MSEKKMKEVPLVLKTPDVNRIRVRVRQKRDRDGSVGRLGLCTSRIMLPDEKPSSKEFTPERMFDIATYWLMRPETSETPDNQLGVPAFKASAFKWAMIDTLRCNGGASFSDKKLNMKECKPLVFGFGDYDEGSYKQVHNGNFFEIVHSDVIREPEIVPTGTGPKVTSYRPLFLDWSCEFELQFVASRFTVKQIAQWLHDAGTLSGIGEKRPSVGCAFGTFEVEGIQEILMPG